MVVLRLTEDLDAQTDRMVFGKTRFIHGTGKRFYSILYCKHCKHEIKL